MKCFLSSFWCISFFLFALTLSRISETIVLSPHFNASNSNNTLRTSDSPYETLGKAHTEHLSRLSIPLKTFDIKDASTRFTPSATHDREVEVTKDVSSHHIATGIPCKSYDHGTDMSSLLTCNASSRETQLNLSHEDHRLDRRQSHFVDRVKSRDGKYHDKRRLLQEEKIIRSTQKKQHRDARLERQPVNSAIPPELQQPQLQLQQPTQSQQQPPVQQQPTQSQQQPPVQQQPTQSQQQPPVQQQPTQSQQQPPVQQQPTQSQQQPTQPHRQPQYQQIQKQEFTNQKRVDEKLKRSRSTLENTNVKQKETDSIFDDDDDDIGDMFEESEDDWSEDKEEEVPMMRVTEAVTDRGNASSLSQVAVGPKNNISGSFIDSTSTSELKKVVKNNNATNNRETKVLSETVHTVAMGDNQGVTDTFLGDKKVTGAKAGDEKVGQRHVSSNADIERRNIDEAAMRTGDEDSMLPPGDPVYAVTPRTYGSSEYKRKKRSIEKQEDAKQFLKNKERGINSYVGSDHSNDSQLKTRESFNVASSVSPFTFVKKNDSNLLSFSTTFKDPSYIFFSFTWMKVSFPRCYKIVEPFVSNFFLALFYSGVMLRGILERTPLIGPYEVMSSWILPGSNESSVRLVLLATASLTISLCMLALMARALNYVCYPFHIRSLRIEVQTLSAKVAQLDAHLSKEMKRSVTFQERLLKAVEGLGSAAKEPGMVSVNSHSQAEMINLMRESLVPVLSFMDTLKLQTTQTKDALIDLQSLFDYLATSVTRLTQNMVSSDGSSHATLEDFKEDTLLQSSDNVTEFYRISTDSRTVTHDLLPLSNSLDCQRVQSEVQEDQNVRVSQDFDWKSSHPGSMDESRIKNVSDSHPKGALQQKELRLDPNPCDQDGSYVEQKLEPGSVEKTSDYVKGHPDACDTTSQQAVFTEEGKGSRSVQVESLYGGHEKKIQPDNSDFPGPVTNSETRVDTVFNTTTEIFMPGKETVPETFSMHTAAPVSPSHRHVEVVPRPSMPTLEDSQSLYVPNHYDMVHGPGVSQGGFAHNVKEHISSDQNNHALNGTEMLFSRIQHEVRPLPLPQRVHQTNMFEPFPYGTHDNVQNIPHRMMDVIKTGGTVDSPATMGVFHDVYSNYSRGLASNTESRSNALSTQPPQFTTDSTEGYKVMQHPDFVSFSGFNVPQAPVMPGSHAPCGQPGVSGGLRPSSPMALNHHYTLGGSPSPLGTHTLRPLTDENPKILGWASAENRRYQSQVKRRPVPKPLKGISDPFAE